jgi:hypothetical protein
MISTGVGRVLQDRPEVDVRGGASPSPEPGSSRVPDSPGESLLVSKLAVPPLPGGLVVRSRLHDLLDTGTRGPLTVLVAPAGWGKTVLLSSWATDRGRIGWLALEPDDTGGRFWRYLHAALDAAGVPGPLPVPESGGYWAPRMSNLACPSGPGTTSNATALVSSAISSNRRPTNRFAE